MTALGEWLKQLILIVILAVFADMLLPTKNMQKYVRVVMGLVIIAAMLQPIVPFFSRDWADKVAADLSNEVTSSTTVTPPSSPDLTRLRTSLAEQESSTANRMLAASLAAQIETQFHCTVESISVQNAANPGELTVTVNLPLSAGDKADDIRSWVANSLQINVANVTVATGKGGEDSGF